MMISAGAAAGACVPERLEIEVSAKSPPLRAA
jgi:hypothetical protein